MRSGVQLATSATAGVVLGLMAAASIVTAFSTPFLGEYVPIAMCILVVVQGLAAGWGVWLLKYRSQRAETRCESEAQRSQELLERLRVAVKAAGLECWEFDWQTRKVVWVDYDQEARRSLQAAEKLGRARIDSILPEDLETAKALVIAATARREPRVAVRYRRHGPDGSLRHMQSYQRFFYDENGKPIRTLGATVDITDSVQREMELEALSIRFDIATRAAHAGVWEWRQDTDTGWWNDTMFEIHGLPVTPSPPPINTVATMIHPDDLAEAQANLDRILSGSDQTHTQFRIIRHDGHVVHLDAAALLVKGTGASDGRVIGITLDVSERVTAEQRERLLQKQLRETSHQSGMAEVATGVLHNVGNVLNSLGVSSSMAHARLRTSQLDRLERIAAMLDTKRHALAEFFANDPRGRQLPEYLTALGGQLREDVEELDRELDAIDSHVHYLRNVVQAQQSFARGGRAEEAVNVRELLETALTLKGQELKSAQITCDIAQMLEVWTNRYKLLQIVVNFVANASDAVAANEPGERRIAIRAQLTGGWLEIAVEDSGVGIPADQLRRVWEFGFTTKTQGHGFGLHSAAVAAQQLGGNVVVSSAGLGQGACFSVRIPANPASSNGSDAPRMHGFSENPAAATKIRCAVAGALVERS